MKFIGKILKWLSFSVLSLVSLVGLLVLVVLQWPSLVLTPRTIELGRKMAAKSGIELKWDQFAIEAESLSFLSKRFLVGSKNLCVSMREPVMKACFDEFAVAVAIDLSRFSLSFKELGPVRIAGGDVYYEAGPRPEKPDEEKPAEEKPPSEGGGFMEWVRDAKVNPIDIEIKRWRYRDDHQVMTGHLILGSDQLSQGARVRLDAAADDRRGTKCDAKLRFENPEDFWAIAQWRAEGRINASFPGRTKAGVRLALTPRADNRVLEGGFDYDYQVSANYSQGKKSAALRIDGNLKPERVQARLAARAESLAPSLTRVLIQNCDADLKKSGQGGHVDVSCPVDMRIAVPPSPIRGVKIPSDISVDLELSADTASFPPNPTERVSGSLELKLKPILNPLFEGSGGAKAQFAGIATEFPQRFDLDTKLGLVLKIPRFQKLVALLKDSQWAVPAPFHVLKGSIEFAADGDLDLKKGGDIPMRLTTRLSSPEQKLDIDARGEAKLVRMQPSPIIDLTMGVNLTDIRLQLPRLAKAPPPRFFPDPRIKPFEQAVAAAPQVPETRDAFRYEIGVQTVSPIKLISNLAQAPIPIQMRFELDSSVQGPQGRVQVMRFPLELFRRDAVVDRLNLTMASPTSESPIDGAVKVKYTDYTVTILAVGTMGKPTFVFQSDPPLPESQVISVLLFGRPMDDLGSDQAESVGNTQAALADRAIGLASLYVLASTPVQSIGYDPSSGTVSAKVRLGEGTSLNLGGTTSGRLSNVGVKRRLGPHWTIETEIAQNQMDPAHENLVETFLEWSNRY